jgi:hypothetical protein
LDFFWRKIQRRGTHVSTPKIGSRDGVFVFGGILEFHADLRREIVWGNLKLGFFWGLFGSPRRSGEEGGHSCVSFVLLREFCALEELFEVSWVGFCEFF